MVGIFNELYKKFLCDKDCLNKIVSKLGDKSYYFEHFVNRDFSLVTLEVINPFFNIFDEKKAFIRLIKRNDDYYAKAANGTNCFQMNYKEKTLALDNNDIKTSLEIVKKNNLFLKSFSDLSCKYIFGNGTTTIVSLIAGDVLGKLTTFTLSFGNSFLNSTDFIKIIFKLGNNFEILYDKSEVNIENIKINKRADKKRVIDELLFNIYINKDKLNELCKQEEVNSKVYVKKGLIK